MLVVGPLPPPVHGASRVTQAVLQALTASGNDEGVEVASVSTAGVPEGHPVRYHLSRVLAHGRAVRVLVDRADRRPTVLYLGGAGGGGLWYQLGLVALARVLGVAVVFHHHSAGYLAAVHPAMRAIVRVLGPRDTHVCLSSSMTRAFRSRYAPAGRVLTVSNARFVRDDVVTRGDEVAARLRLVHVSNLSVDKGTVRVVDAFRRLRAGGADVSLVLVGEAADPDVRTAVDAARRDHPESFHHHGRASQDEVYQALDAADLFVFPSAYRYEAQPLVVLEALARGLPVLASDRGSLADLLPSLWLIDETLPLDVQIAGFVPPDDRGRLGVEAREAFDRSRRGGDDLLAELIGNGRSAVA